MHHESCVFARADKTEDNPTLQAVVSLLSSGPVGVGDRIGYTDIGLVRRSDKRHSLNILAPPVV